MFVDADILYIRYLYEPVSSEEVIIMMILQVIFTLILFNHVSIAFSPSVLNRLGNIKAVNVLSSRTPPVDLQSMLQYSSTSISLQKSNYIKTKNEKVSVLNPFKVVLDTTKKVKTFFQTQLPMLQYLWPADNLKLRFYLTLSLVFLFTGKYLNTKVPFILQRAIDNLPLIAASSGISSSTGIPVTTDIKAITRSISMAFILYGFSKAFAVICEELKTCLFTHASQNVLRKFAYQIFTHLHTLGSDFHLQTPSGVISVAYVRAVRGFQALMFQLIFSVAPTMLELFLVAKILSSKFSPIFAMITVGTFTSYLLFTLYITQWRIRLRKNIVYIDNARNGFFIDSLLNHEVVKLFNNEKKEMRRFDRYLSQIQRLNIESTYSIGLLNIGQAILFCTGLVSSLLIALRRVETGSMSVGDLVAVNSLLLQLAIPFDFIGYTYQEIRQALVDMAYMTQVLNSFNPAVPDAPNAVAIEALLPRPPLAPSAPVPAVAPGDQENGMHTDNHSDHSSDQLPVVQSPDHRQEARPPAYLSPTAPAQKYEFFPQGQEKEEYKAHLQRSGKSSSYVGRGVGSTIEFKNVQFSYRKSNKNNKGGEGVQSAVLLDNISFKIRAGEDVAIVGPSGSGKSTTLKLITRMLDVDSGEILLDGVNIAHATKESVRQLVSVVPQDNCLFDDTVEYNIKYGHPYATTEEVQEVVKLSSLSNTIEMLPEGLGTVVGERGARLSGGERQKVSIARALLRRPSLLLCDEVTSSVDALAEREIIEALRASSTPYTSSRTSNSGTTDSTTTDSTYSRESMYAHTQHALPLPGRTTITVAHRLSSIIHCDRILVLQKGRVVEEGTHTELLTLSNGVYRHLWEVQNNIDQKNPKKLKNPSTYSDEYHLTHEKVLGSVGNL